MLFSRVNRHAHLVWWLVVIATLTAPVASAQSNPTEPFNVPKDRAEWEARRPRLLKEAQGNFGKEFPDDTQYSVYLGDSEPLADHPTVLVASVRAVPLVMSGNYAIDGQLLRPAQLDPERKPPLVVLFVDPRPDGPMATRPGWDGRPPALVLVQMGFAVLLFDHPSFLNYFAYRNIFPVRAILDSMLQQGNFDPVRIAVFGLGKSGFTALNLMARDPRFSCGIVAIEAELATKTLYAETKGSKGGISTHYQELAALCAPKSLQLMIGEPLPLPDAKHSAGRLLERAAKGTYKLYGKEGQLNFTLFGEFAGHESISTRLQWLMGLEWLDKHFRPQGPTPLPHEPESEPAFDAGDPSVLNLTEHGIAGWSSEMSFRPSTFTWKDGVVVCQPGPHEYGWLRAPVEVDDFLLQVEWQVPKHGNAGIFLRGQPVDWILPPTEENKLRVSTLALTWPSRTGLELQTQDDAGVANRYSSGSIYRHAAPSENPTNPPGEWNRSTVRARGTRVVVWNNGKQVLDADLTKSSDTLPNPPLRGFIGLQNHGNPASYRNVKLKRL